jgi:Rrf2 family protein
MFYFFKVRGLMKALTRKCQYALRALYCLAHHYGNGPIQVSSISSVSNAPPEFLEIILLELKNAGLLESRRGRRGGYALVVPPDQVFVGSVIRLMDGPLINLPCVVDQWDESNAKPCADCREIAGCETRHFMAQVHEAAAAILDKISLASACRQVEYLGCRSQWNGIPSLP